MYVHCIIIFRKKQWQACDVSGQRKLEDCSEFVRKPQPVFLLRKRLSNGAVEIRKSTRLSLRSIFHFLFTVLHDQTFLFGIIFLVGVHPCVRPHLIQGRHTGLPLRPFRILLIRLPVQGIVLNIFTDPV